MRNEMNEKRNYRVHLSTPTAHTIAGLNWQTAGIVFGGPLTTKRDAWDMVKRMVTVDFASSIARHVEQGRRNDVTVMVFDNTTGELLWSASPCTDEWLKVVAS